MAPIGHPRYLVRTAAVCQHHILKMQQPAVQTLSNALMVCLVEGRRAGFDAVSLLNPILIFAGRWAWQVFRLPFTVICAGFDAVSLLNPILIFAGRWASAGIPLTVYRNIIQLSDSEK
jgi:hypothetical protein